MFPWIMGGNFKFFKSNGTILGLVVDRCTFLSVYCFLLVAYYYLAGVKPKFEFDDHDCVKFLLDCSGDIYRTTLLSD